MYIFCLNVKMSREKCTIYFQEASVIKNFGFVLIKARFKFYYGFVINPIHVANIPGRFNIVLQIHLYVYILVNAQIFFP